MPEMAQNSPRGFEEELSEAFTRMLNTQADPRAVSSQDSSAVQTPTPEARVVPENASHRTGTEGGGVQSDPEPPIKTIEPNAGPAEIAQFMQSIMQQHERVMGALDPSLNQKFPVESVPAYARDSYHPDLTTGGTMYDAKDMANSGLTSTMDLITRALRTLDIAQEHLAAPAPEVLIPPAAPSSSTGAPPQLWTNLAAALSHSNNLVSSMSNSFGGNWMSREMARTLQGNELYLRATARTLYLQLQSKEPASPGIGDLQSAFGLTVLHLYELTHDDKDLDVALVAVSQALSQDAVGTVSPTTALRIRNWTYSQRLLARRERTVEPLDNSIDIAKRMLDIFRTLYPEISPESRDLLALELAECLLDRYRALGEVTDLDRALQILPTSQGKSDMLDTHTLCVLSELHLERFLRTWDLDDLDQMLYHTVGLRELDEPLIGAPPAAGASPHPDASRGLRLLALAHALRFEVVMDIDDLDKAVTYSRKAVKKCPEDHPLYVVFLTTLGTLLYRRYEADEDIADLDECVEKLEIAAQLPVERCYVHYPAQAALGLALARRGDLKDDLRELDDGVRHLQQTRKAFFGGAHLEARIERDLARALFFRFRLTQYVQDLDDAIQYAASAFDRAPPDDQSRASLGLQLGQMLLLCAIRKGRTAKCDNAIDVLRTVATGPGRATIRLKAAMEWAKAAKYIRGPEAALEALDVALDVLPHIAWAGNRMVVQYRTLASLSADVGPWAAACAISCGRLEDAISYLERGRNVLWSQSLQLSLSHHSGAAKQSSSQPRQPTTNQANEFASLSSYLSRNADGLPDPETIRARNAEMEKRNPELFKMIDGMRSVYKDMRAKAMAHPGHRPGDFDRIDAFRDIFKGIFEDASLHSAAKRHSTLRTTLDDLQEGASGLASLGDLQSNSSLSEVLERGHVVFLNVHTSRCDAIILSRSPSGSVDAAHVPLPELSLEDIRDWAEAIQVGRHDLEQGGMGVRDFDEVILVPILQGLWHAMAAPVVSRLGVRSGQPPIRIWWCPTGPLALLPIHAAGPYEDDAPGLPELVISSYIPTLHSLLRAHEASRQRFSLLAIGHAETPGQTPLPAVRKELATIQRACARLSHLSTPTIMEGPSATSLSVSSALPSYTWLHFSCHAYQDPSHPFKSAFFMHDAPLRLGVLMQLDLSRVQFAFLSACLTSAGDERLPDESIHLAAGLQFAGVRAAVATLWSVDDRSAAWMAERVYAHLMREGGEEPDPLEAAEALHRAMGALKAAGKPMVFWVPFIHVGI
ncbi:hypothetical protein OH77DRAFT_1476957 [Trametes cingulata]|nr:hypothetical protein OH77DRAFT_1476957 [Trametes cingulata]